MKNLRPLLFFVSLLLIVGLACSFFGQGGDKPTQAPPPTDQPIQIDDEPTSEPTEPPATEPPEPTEPPTPEAQQYFTEEFDNPLSDSWTSFTLYDSNEADLDKVKV
jgi:hypothetical protein